MLDHIVNVLGSSRCPTTVSPKTPDTLFYLDKSDLRSQKQPSLHIHRNGVKSRLDMKTNMRLIFAFALLMTGMWIQAQAVLQRTADLMNEGYVISGDAVIEELANGDLQLRLTDDFSTPNGPDVRIYLNNSLAVSGAVEIVNLSTIGHFNGAATFPVPAGTGINDNSRVFFWCFAFNQLWASGTFGPTMTPPGFTCEDSGVSFSDGSFDRDICPTDGNSDVLQFTNTINATLGTNYAYLITDQNELLLEVLDSDSYNFEGSTLDEQRVYGVHYSGTLSPSFGAPRSATVASDCHTHSSSTDYAKITKNACPPPYMCETSNVTTDNLQSLIDICPTDGQSDLVYFTNSTSELAGDHYAYIITDANEIVQTVIFNDFYDFESTTLDEQRVYGVHFDGTLFPAVGQDRFQTMADGCFEHSSDMVTITKNACPPVFDCLTNAVSLVDGSTSIEICAEDGQSDIISLDNTIGAASGDHYAYLITDQDETLIEVVTGNSYNFDGSSSEQQRVYGIHFDGTLTPVIGQDRSQTTASECFEHSTGSFVTVLKSGCPPPFECQETTVSLVNGDDAITICPVDEEADIITFVNNQSLSTQYAYLITNSNDILLEVVTSNSYDFNGSGLGTQRVHGVHFEGTLNPQIGQIRVATTATGCVQHSSASMFLTIEKEDCTPSFECLTSLTATTDWLSEVTLCPEDGQSDVVALRNTIMETSSEHYAYLITDENEVLQEVVLDSFFNFEGTSLEPQRVYGLHYDGILEVKIGEVRTNTTASECHEHSGGNIFLSIMKAGCPATFECQETLTATDDWATAITVCAEDAVANVNFRNSKMIQAGVHYAYLITDSSEVLQEVVLDSIYDFAGSGSEVQRVYGLSYDGDLIIQLGQDRKSTTASGCFTHSGDNLFLTVSKDGCIAPFECVESLTASFAWETNIDICTTDGEQDEILIQNNIDTPPGDHYAFLITDENENLLEVLLDSLYDFEGTGTETVRVYGISYDGILKPAIGQNRKETSATNCFLHSGDNLYITVNKTASCATAVDDTEIGEAEINVFPNPTNGLITIAIDGDQEIQNINVIDMTGKVVSSSDKTEIYLPSAAVYYLQIKTSTTTVFRKVMRI